MRRKDSPQLFELMRTKLAGKLQPPLSKVIPPPARATSPISGAEASVQPAAVYAPEPGEGRAGGAVPAADLEPPPPSPVSPPLILPPVAVAETAAPVAAPPARTAEPATQPAAAAEPEVVSAPPPPEPVFHIPPPKPKPRAKARPFVIKPPAPGLLESGPEQRVVLPYPWALAATAALFVLVFLAFALGRAGASSSAAGRTGARGDAAGRDVGGNGMVPSWTLCLLAYETSEPAAGNLDLIRTRLQERLGVRTRLREWTDGGSRYRGLLAESRWTSSEDPQLARLREMVQDKDVLGDGQYYFSECRPIREP